MEPSGVDEAVKRQLPTNENTAPMWRGVISIAGSGLIDYASPFKEESDVILMAQKVLVPPVDNLDGTSNDLIEIVICGLNSAVYEIDLADADDGQAAGQLRPGLAPDWWTDSPPL
jgi:hypothetical protein